MTVIAWILLGLVGGVVGGRVHSLAGGSIVLDGAFGVVGGLIGGLVFQLVGPRGVAGFNMLGLFAAIVGALIVLRGYHFLMQMRNNRRRRQWESYARSLVE
ncbi:MAG: hypothetical protein A2289_14345 [Deltaproteobacteria bacterium RIFOXYA12_FULL_58_15]|nr:MAG: hypothetical protein A2289_14345 [Deltaproteobacteria bacterium RIFOXYA12_FULL_58_15]OGR13999.1 MAG: hypothetical protein A2341_24775 [Deltaproteobacteria bacterium RIFOXYB12_FULL_58_9]